MQHEGLLLPKHDCCGFWKSSLGWSRHRPSKTPLRKRGASLHSGAQANEQIGLDEGNRWGLVQPAPPVDGNEVRSCSRTMFHTRWRPTPTEWPTARVIVEELFSKRCKTSSSNWGGRKDLPRPVPCLLTANVPVSHSNGRQNRTYDNLDTLMINPLLFPAVVIRYTVRRMNVGKFGPGATLHVDVGLITVAILVKFWVRHSTQMTLQALPQEVRERVDMRTAHTSVPATSLSAVYRGRWAWCVRISALIWYELQLFFRNSSVVFLDF
jgi:hypothetical protein